MFTFEERLNEGISGTDAKANGETAADIMKVVKEEVLLVSWFTRRNLHLWENDVEKIFYPFYGEKEEIAKLVRDVGRLFFNSVKVYFNWSLSLLWMKWCHPLRITWIGAFYSLAHIVLLSKHFVIFFFQSTEIRRGPKSRAWRVLDGVNAVHVGASHPQLHGWSLQTSKWCQTMKSNMNPLTPLSDQDRIRPYNYNAISSRQVMRMEKNNN